MGKKEKRRTNKIPRKKMNTYATSKCASPSLHLPLLTSIIIHPHISISQGLVSILSHKYMRFTYKIPLTTNLYTSSSSFLPYPPRLTSTPTLAFPTPLHSKQNHHPLNFISIHKLLLLFPSLFASLWLECPQAAAACTSSLLQPYYS